jgi:hypothetical protein
LQHSKIIYCDIKNPLTTRRNGKHNNKKGWVRGASRSSPWPITFELAGGRREKDPRSRRNPSHHRVPQIQRRRRVQIQMRTDLPRSEPPPPSFSPVGGAGAGSLRARGSNGGRGCHRTS